MPLWDVDKGQRKVWEGFNKEVSGNPRYIGRELNVMYAMNTKQTVCDSKNQKR